MCCMFLLYYYLDSYYMGRFVNNIEDFVLVIVKQDFRKRFVAFLLNEP